MADIAISGAIVALKKVVFWLGNQAIEAGSRLFKLKQDILWIEKEMEYIQAYLRYFDDANQSEASNTVETALVKNVRLLAYDIEDILESYLLKIASKKGKGSISWIKNMTQLLSHSNIALSFSLEIDEIKKRVEDINRVRQTYGITPRTKKFIGMDERRSFPHTEEGHIIGMDEKVKELQAKLQNNYLNHLVLPITGTAGLGKTTLAKKVYNSVMRDFNCKAWICVSQQPNIPELLRELAEQVELDEDKLNRNLEFNLHKYLSEKRYIIIIDDLWQNDAWNGLKKGIPTNSVNGSRIILTSRSKEVGEYVGGKGSVYELKPLDKTQSSELFFKIIKGNVHQGNIEEKGENLSQSLLDIGEKILHKCNGIPLAIVLASGMLSLRERAEYAWKGVLESMDKQEDKFSQIFELSYKDLRSELRPCFLYFGLFPEDYQIHSSILINLWAAERFIESSEVREVEEVGEDYLNQLVVRNLVQVSSRKINGRINTCQVHDILHSFCVRMAKEINFFRINNDISRNSMIVSRVRRYAYHEGSPSAPSSSGLGAPKLRALLQFGFEYEKANLNLICELEYLRVVFIEKMEARVVPRKIGNLIHVAYLRLGKSVGGKIPSAIGNLKSLITLDARECYKGEIPSCIWEMECLRHILLGRECQIKYPVLNQVCNVKAINLRTLCWLHLPYTLTGPKEYDFPNLRKLGLSYNKNVNATIIKELLKNAPKIEVLKIVPIKRKKDA